MASAILRVYFGLDRAIQVIHNEQDGPACKLATATHTLLGDYLYESAATLIVCYFASSTSLDTFTNIRPLIHIMMYGSLQLTHRIRSSSPSASMSRRRPQSLNIETRSAT